MLLTIILFLLLGIAVGTFTGLTPGIHINLVGALIVSLSASILGAIQPIYLVVFITSMAITHTFVDFIPSIFLGCPDTDTELSVLPGHELLKKGLGYQAVALTAYGGLGAVIILILTSFPLILLISKTYNLIKDLIPYILILISTFLILSEKRKFSAFFAFLLTGFLGLCVLNLDVNQPLLPLLTGLFGSSMLILSIKNKFKIPEQKISKPKVKIARPLIGAFISSPLCGFLPGLGSGQAAILGTTISRTKGENFLVLLGATNTLVMGFSFISIYAISKTRTGAAAAIKNLVGNLSADILILILIITLIAGILSFFITIILTKFLIKKINKVNYSTISIITLVILLTITLLVSGIIGFIVLIASTFTGIYCIHLKVRRTIMMGCLLIPTIILYLF